MCNSVLKINHVICQNCELKGHTAVWTFTKCLCDKSHIVAWNHAFWPYFLLDSCISLTAINSKTPQKWQSNRADGVKNSHICGEETTDGILTEFCTLVGINNTCANFDDDQWRVCGGHTLCFSIALHYCISFWVPICHFVQFRSDWVTSSELSISYKL